MLLRLDEVARRIGERTLFENVSLEVRAGDRVGLIGPNGAGKTTLLRIAAGLETPDAGAVSSARGARVALLRQELDPRSNRSVRDEAASALAHLEALERELGALEAQMAREGEVSHGLAERYDRARHAFEQQGGFEREARIERVLDGLGFDPERRERPLSALSGGWLMRVELAKLLLAEPDVLLLDEPTNHLDLPSIEWFEETLAAFRGGVVVISHDRAFLRRHATRIAELARGRFEVTEGGFEQHLAQREARRDQAEARLRGQAKERAAAERFIERFRAKASKAKQVKSREKRLARMEQVELEPENRKRIRLKIPKAARGGRVMLALEGVHKAYGETKVYEGVDLEIGRGERVALVGPNGAGKSTLLRLLAGVLEADAGERRVGHNVEIAFYAQHQLEALDAGDTVLGSLERLARLEDHPRLRGHLGAFLFHGDDVQKKVSVLSGGEKARLALARMLLHPANLLVLDEPTNHLDVEACEVLENALRSYDGTLVFISHDRDFINAIASRVVEVRAGTLREFLGGFDAYKAALASEASGGLSSGEPEASAEPAPAAVDPEPTASPEARREARRVERERQKTVARAKRRIEKLEGEILEAETELEALGWRLGDPEVHRDGEQVRALEAERATLQQRIDALYREWETSAAELEAAADAPEV